MTDLTYCYLHMRRNDLLIIDTIETSDYINGDLSDEEIDVPPSMVPPNPDETDILPSQVHPSYPYGNPTSLKHPAARPRPPYDPSSRALFEDMGFGGGGINGALKWKELGLSSLLPVDEAKEEAKRAMQARKMASGAASNNPQVQQQHNPPQIPQGQPNDDDDDDDDDEQNDDTTLEEGDDDDEGDGEDEDEDGDGDEEDESEGDEE